MKNCAPRMEHLKRVERRVPMGQFWVLFGLLALVVPVQTAAAAQRFDTSCPQGFFTNIASRLLSAQMNVDMCHIQIYPTNQYTPAVHRLLQVSANILDATTTNFYPSVFRPLFWKTNEECDGVWQTNIYIAGYQYVQEPLTNGIPIFTEPTDAGDPAIPFGLSGVTNNIYGVPWIIGVKKGLPNFNGLEIDNNVFIERLLQFNRQNANLEPGAAFPFGRNYTTNQMYVMGISNCVVSAEWNSYASNYEDPVAVVARDTFCFGLSNDAAGFVPVTSCFITNAVASSIAGWPGTATSLTSSFVFPMGTNVCLAQNLSSPFNPVGASSLYVYFDGSAFGSINSGAVTYTAPCFIPALPNLGNFVNSGTPPLPHLVMLTTNRIQAYILDTKNPDATYILDYVQLGGMNGCLDVNQAIADPDNTGLWSTNIFAGNTSFGVNEQYLVSSGMPFPSVVDSDETTGSGSQIGWTQAPVPGLRTATPLAEISYFQAFFSATDQSVYLGQIVTNTVLSILAPFTPMRLIVQRYVYQANDPLVHYLTSDLIDFVDDTNGHYSLSLPPPTPKHVVAGQVSDRYMPWGTAGNLANAIFNGVPADDNAYNLSYKDPLVESSDDWNFPTNETLSASWLGQVHRGTPWQTIYLKSPDILAEIEISGSEMLNIGPATWEIWTGDLNLTDAVSMAPVQDWRMAVLLASLFNTNHDSSLFSANDSNPNDWESLFNGMTVLTNDVNDFAVNFQPIPQFATLTISADSTQAAEIADAIESARTAAPGRLFASAGDIFAVPQLSAESPYLNLDQPQIQAGINDPAYEAIPDQLLPLLRIDSIGSVTAADGDVIIEFTGDDNHVYGVQKSPNLTNWTTISTNCPVNGIFTVTNAAAGAPCFYRTVLLQ